MKLIPLLVLFISPNVFSSESDTCDERKPWWTMEENCKAYPDGHDYLAAGDLFNPCPERKPGPVGEIFGDLIDTMILSACVLAPPCDYPDDIGDVCMDNPVYDFIVVGAGTAGSVVAARLSEIADWKILLIEAGGNPPITSDVPYFYEYLQGTDVDWGFQSITEKGLFNGLNGGISRWPKGRVLGGTSTINSMLYARGNRIQFDNLAAEGNLGWSYSEVLNYYKKSVDMRDISVLNSPLSHLYHGQGGPLPLSRFGSSDKDVIKLIQDAGIEIGYPAIFDVNGASNMGFTYPSQGTIKNGERVNSAKAFLNPAKTRKNLFVLKNSLVSRVIICPKTKRAYAVEYYYKSSKKPRIARASREVILSAGVIGSAKILLLSGVGPKEELETVGVLPLQNLMVGRNLHDHVQFPGIVATLDTSEEPYSSLDILDETYEYLSRRKGVLAGIGARNMIGFVSIDDDDIPDIVLQFQYGRINDSDTLGTFYKNLGLKSELLEKIIGLNNDDDVLIPIPILLHPKSRGRVTLASNSYAEDPFIETNYFSEPEDGEVLLKGIRFIEHLLTTDAMLSANTSIFYLEYEGCCHIEKGSDQYYACAMSHVATTNHDQGGTCKMGPSSDKNAVVDPLLRVIGIKGLRVADMSILPSGGSGLSMATTLVIGEKAADLIKLQWLPGYTPTTPYPSAHARENSEF